MTASIHVPGFAKGEYRIEHLRAKPECLGDFMPLWEQHLALLQTAADMQLSLEMLQAGGDFSLEIMLTRQIREKLAQVDELRAKMRPFQTLVSEETFTNLVTTVGKNLLLDTILGNSAAGVVRMGLKGAGSAAAGDTQASHSGWLEQGLANAPTYSGNRPTPSFSAASSASKTTSAAVAFSITSSGTVAGAFINIGGSATIDNTTGTLFSAGDYTGGNKTVANTDTLNVSYTLSA